MYYKHFAYDDVYKVTSACPLDYSDRLVYSVLWTLSKEKRSSTCQRLALRLGMCGGHTVARARDRLIDLGLVKKKGRRLIAVEPTAEQKAAWLRPTKTGGYQFVRVMRRKIGSPLTHRQTYLLSLLVSLSERPNRQTISGLAKMTGFDNRTVRQGIKALIALKLITKEGNRWTINRLSVDNPLVQQKRKRVATTVWPPPKIEAAPTEVVGTAEKHAPVAASPPAPKVASAATASASMPAVFAAVETRMRNLRFTADQIAEAVAFCYGNEGPWGLWPEGMDRFLTLAEEENAHNAENGSGKGGGSPARLFLWKIKKAFNETKERELKNRAAYAQQENEKREKAEAECRGWRSEKLTKDNLWSSTGLWTWRVQFDECDHVLLKEYPPEAVLAVINSFEPKWKKTARCSMSEFCAKCDSLIPQKTLSSSSVGPTLGVEEFLGELEL